MLYVLSILGRRSLLERGRCFLDECFSNRCLFDVAAERQRPLAHCSELSSSGDVDYSSQCRSLSQGNHLRVRSFFVTSQDIAANQALHVRCSSTSEIVWARLHGFPWWPALVVKPDGLGFQV